jgi:trans-aconitate 2-methyltransferase
VQRAHHWDAEDYARNSSAQTQWALELIDKLALGGQETLLDLGCGNGVVTGRLAEILRDGQVTGLDSSAEMIRLARERFPADRYPNLRFVEMDAAAIRLPGQFDVVFSNAALHWVQDQAAVLRGVRSCLRPRGRLLFQMGGQGNAAEILSTLNALARLPRWRSRLEGFACPYFFQGPEQYRRRLSELGFHPGRVELVEKDMQHSGTDGLKGWLRTTWFPYTDRLPPAEREPFLDELLAAYLARVPLDAEGRTHVKMVRLEVEAVLEYVPPGNTPSGN